jgi:hypothetical protein
MTDRPITRHPTLSTDNAPNARGEMMWDSHQERDFFLDFAPPSLPLDGELQPDEFLVYYFVDYNNIFLFI